MAFKDYYKILTVSKNASLKEIKDSYSKLLKRYNPDIIKGNKAFEEKLNDVNEAYDVLSDENKRKSFQTQYDAYYEKERQSSPGTETVKRKETEVQKRKPVSVISGRIFEKENYIWMLGGLVIIAIGMFLLSGGVSNKDPNVFDSKAVYSPIRITIAPILILAGLMIEIFAIFRKPKIN
jgi:DnaJ-class molecular chaperone